MRTFAILVSAFAGAFFASLLMHANLANAAGGKLADNKVAGVMDEEEAAKAKEAKAAEEKRYALLKPLTYEVMQKDSESLSKFSSELALGISQESRIIRFLSNDTKSFQELMLMLYRRGVLKTDSMKRLAGASGKALTDAEYSALKMGVQKSMPTGACIFTGPANKTDLMKCFKGSAGEEGEVSLLMCYNGAWQHLASNIGVVAICSGSTTAAVYTHRQLHEDLHFKPAPFGTAPFQFVAPW